MLMTEDVSRHRNLTVITNCVILAVGLADQTKRLNANIKVLPVDSDSIKTTLEHQIFPAHIKKILIRFFLRERLLKLFRSKLHLLCICICICTTRFL